jgi:hypothetical protein
MLRVAAGLRALWSPSFAVTQRQEDGPETTAQFVLSPFSRLSLLGLCRVIGYIFRMNAYRHVKLFKNGRNQAVRIPREFEFPGEDAIMRRDGDKLIIEAAPPR